MAVKSSATKKGEAPSFLTLDDEFRLFCWALNEAKVISDEQFKAALTFIKRVRDEQIPLKAGLDRCREVGG